MAINKDDNEEANKDSDKEKREEAHRNKRREEIVLAYHEKGRRGKIEVVPSKPCSSQRDLSIAYSPGVAIPCLKIQENPDDAYKYTAKGNLVAVVTNGSAVLGLGDIGALAGKPVMEGKGVLFKKFADIDVFDIELDTHDPDKFIEAVKLMAPTFGGINLEDISAPNCFYIEDSLKKALDIPVFHDDQHGTAIISAAALLNALEIVAKKIEDVSVVVNGAGAAGISCARLYISLGVRASNVIMCDSRGVIYKGRSKSMTAHKAEFAIDTDKRTLADALAGADVFAGLSVGGVVSKDMVRSMNDNPIVFAMANPDPEISYPDAISARSDVIMATGRSDYPNQVNNVLGFPFIFRGALDTNASSINEEMKIAATRALAQLAKEPVLDAVLKAYNVRGLDFGREYIIPKPFDPRALIYVASAVARAAVDTGVARSPIVDFEAYRLKLEKIHGTREFLVRKIINRVKHKQHFIVFPEGSTDKIIKAAHIISDEHIATPILLGNKDTIEHRAGTFGISLDKIKIIDPLSSPKIGEYAKRLYELRQRKGIFMNRAYELLKQNLYFGMMMLESGDADGIISGVTTTYPETLKPALEIIKIRNNLSVVAGFYLVMFKERTLIFADTTVNIDPTAEQLAQIALNCSKAAKVIGIKPRIAMLSFSNFGSVRHKASAKVAEAVSIIRKANPNLIVDGEMRADVALSPELIEEFFPFSHIRGKANILIFPELQSANIAYKLVSKLADTELIGPLLTGMQRPVNVIEKGSSVENIVNIATVTALEIDEGTF